jgi:hypothetical protein
MLVELLQRLGSAIRFEHGVALGFEGHSVVEPDIRLVIYD